MKPLNMNVPVSCEPAASMPYHYTSSCYPASVLLCRSLLPQVSSPCPSSRSTSAEPTWSLLAANSCHAPATALDPAHPASLLLGPSPTPDVQPLPIKSLNISGASMVSAGSDFTLWLCNGTSSCSPCLCATASFPYTPDVQPLPLKSLNISGANMVSAGSEFTLWLCNGKIWAAGSPQYGQLGDGSNHEYNMKECELPMIVLDQYR